MISVSPFKMLTTPPRIFATRKAIEAIRHIVKIAPQEAQWFHTVEYNQEEDCLLLSEDIYIPEQVCSATEVDSNPTMMVGFYKELSAKHDMQTTNHILSTMTCWCHSHHNMSPNPSGQDVKQFNTFVKQALDQGQASWQIMLIFNKRNEFYSRVYDPNSGNIYEGVNIEVIEETFDFSYIDQAAKNKFKVPKPAVAFSSYVGNPVVFKSKKTNKIEEAQLNANIANQILAQIFDNAALNVSKFKFNKKTAAAYIKNIFQCLNEKEVIWFHLEATGKRSSIPTYGDSLETIKLFEESIKLYESFFLDFLSSGNYGPKDFYNILLKVLTYDDAASTAELCQLVSGAANAG